MHVTDSLKSHPERPTDSLRDGPAPEAVNAHGSAAAAEATSPVPGRVPPPDVPPSPLPPREMPPLEMPPLEMPPQRRPEIREPDLPGEHLPVSDGPLAAAVASVLADAVHRSTAC